MPFILLKLYKLRYIFSLTIHNAKIHLLQYTSFGFIDMFNKIGTGFIKISKTPKSTGNDLGDLQNDLEIEIWRRHPPTFFLPCHGGMNQHGCLLLTSDAAEKNSRGLFDFWLVYYYVHMTCVQKCQCESIELGGLKSKL